MVFWCMNETRWRMRVCLYHGERASAHTLAPIPVRIRWKPIVCFSWPFFPEFSVVFLFVFWFGIRFPTASTQKTAWHVTCLHYFINETKSGRQTNKEKKQERQAHMCALMRTRQCVHIGWQHSFLANFVRTRVARPACVRVWAVTILRWQCQKPIVASTIFHFRRRKCQKTNERAFARFACHSHNTQHTWRRETFLFVHVNHRINSARRKMCWRQSDYLFSSLVTSHCLTFDLGADREIITWQRPQNHAPVPRG